MQPSAFNMRWYFLHSFCIIFFSMKQSTNTVLLVSPTSFGFNPETAGSNVFQHDVQLAKKVIHQSAQEEWERVCAMLVKEKINVIAVMDTNKPIKPDALFPNNWISTHQDGKLILYPLLAHNRRIEKRLDIVNQFTQKYSVTDIVDLSFYEKENQFLEGTGSMVLDRINKIIYACLSVRTYIEPLEHLAKLLGYQVVAFHAYNHEKPIYHTNVVMSVGSDWATICFDAIPDIEERRKIKDFFSRTGKTVVELSLKQIDAFAGNILELESIEGKRKIIMSKTTYDSLDKGQIETFTSFGDICYTDVSTIEKVGGGGIRCLIAEVFL